MCYSCSERCSCRRGVRDDQFVIIFNLNGTSCMSACLFIWTIMDKMALLSAFKALACLIVFLVFFVICSFADNGRRIHSIIVLERKTWLRGLCVISWSTPVLIIGSSVIASRATPDPSRVLSLSLPLNTIVVRSSIFQMKCLCLQVDFLLMLDCGSPLFIGFGVLYSYTCIGQRSRKSQGKGSEIQ